MDDFFEELLRIKMFNRIDLRLGYSLIQIMKGDKKKTISHTSYGSYEFLAMFFGLTNAPAIFCTFTNDIFRKWFDDFVVAYIDKILAYSNSMEEHVEHF
jgi:hypothetical protein